MDACKRAWFTSTWRRSPTFEPRRRPLCKHYDGAWLLVHRLLGLCDDRREGANLLAGTLAGLSAAPDLQARCRTTKMLSASNFGVQRRPIRLCQAYGELTLESGVSTSQPRLEIDETPALGAVALRHFRLAFAIWSHYCIRLMCPGQVTRQRELDCSCAGRHRCSDFRAVRAVLS